MAGSEFVDICKLIEMALPPISSHSAYVAVCRGMVKVGVETIGLPDMMISRARLAGQTVTLRDRSFQIDAAGRRILRSVMACDTSDRASLWP